MEDETNIKTVDRSELSIDKSSHQLLDALDVSYISNYENSDALNLSSFAPTNNKATINKNSQKKKQIHKIKADRIYISSLNSSTKSKTAEEQPVNASNSTIRTHDMHGPFSFRNSDNHQDTSETHYHHTDFKDQRILLRGLRPDNVAIDSPGVLMRRLEAMYLNSEADRTDKDTPKLGDQTMDFENIRQHGVDHSVDISYNYNIDPQMENPQPEIVSGPRNEAEQGGVFALEIEAVGQEQEQEQGEGEQIQLSEEVMRMTREERKRKLKEALLSIARYKYRRATVLCVIMFLESLFLYSVTEGSYSSIQSVCISCYVFLTYSLVENAYRTFLRDVISWKKTENLFDTFDSIIFLIFVILTDFKFRGYHLIMKFVFILPVLNVFAYFCYTRAPKALKDSKLAIRAFVALQIFLFASRFDGDIDWPWRVVICCVWIFFGVIIIYCSFVVFTLLSILVLSIFKKDLYPHVDKTTQILGFLWLSLYSGLGVVTLVIVIGLTVMLDSPNQTENNSLLQISLMVIRYLSFFLSLFSFATFHWIIQFNTKFCFDESEYRMHLGLSDSNGSNTAQVIKEDKFTYFVRLSSTYFSSLHQSFHVRSKDKLAQLKQAARRARAKKFKRGLSKQDSMINSATKINLQPVRPENAGLQVVIHNANKVEEQRDPEIKEQQVKEENKVNEIKEEGLNPDYIKRPRSYTTDFIAQIRKLSMTSPGKQINGSPVCLSEHYRLPSLELEEEAEEEEDQCEKLCYICESKAPNAIMVECGHGGVCVECAVEVIKDKGKCMECRTDISKVVRIDPDPKYKDIIKGYEMITVIQPQKEVTVE